MKQASFDTTLITKKTRKCEFLEQMQLVVPWKALVEMIAPYYPEGLTSQPPFSLEAMLRTHFMQQCFTLSDLAMEEAFFDTPTYREFAHLDTFDRLPDESTKNKDKKRDPEMHSSKKGNQWHIGMKAHIGVASESGLVHTVRGTAAHVSDVTAGNNLLHGQAPEAYGDAGYQGIENRPDAKKDVLWHIVIRPGKRAALDLKNKRAALTDKIEKAKPEIRAKVEQPFRVIKRQFGFIKPRYRGLKKNTAQLAMLFALSNLWMPRGKLLGIGA